MSQEDVLKVLKKLGGRADSSEIRKKAKEMYPDRTLYTYTYDRLQRLYKNKIIKKEVYGDKIIWEIIKK